MSVPRLSFGLLPIVAVTLATIGCNALVRYPARELPPGAAERFRGLAMEEPDDRLRARLIDALDLVQAQWPNGPSPEAPAPAPAPKADAKADAPGPEGGEAVSPPSTAVDTSPLGQLRRTVAEVPDARRRGLLRDQADVIAAAWSAGVTDEGRQVGWFLRPEKVRVDSFTRFKASPEVPDEDGNQPADVLEARVQVLDADGNPMRAVGKFRIELYRFAKRSPDPRGGRLAIWNVDVQGRDDNRRYFDTLINGYTFNLDLESRNLLEKGSRYIVEATFIRPDGTRVYPSSWRYVDFSIEEEGKGTFADPAGGPRKPSTNRLRNPEPDGPLPFLEGDRPKDAGNGNDPKRGR